MFVLPDRLAQTLSSVGVHPSFCTLIHKHCTMTRAATDLYQRKGSIRKLFQAWVYTQAFAPSYINIVQCAELQQTYIKEKAAYANTFKLGCTPKLLPPHTLTLYNAQSCDRPNSRTRQRTQTLSSMGVHPSFCPLIHTHCPYGYARSTLGWSFPQLLTLPFFQSARVKALDIAKTGNFYPMSFEIS